MKKREDYYAEMDASAKKALSDAEEEKKKYNEVKTKHEGNYIYMGTTQTK